MSSFTNSDLLEWEKRFNAEQQSARAIQRPPVNQNNTQVHRMAMQVREVLPDVPYDAVYKDLCKCKIIKLYHKNNHIYYMIKALLGDSRILSKITCCGFDLLFV